MKKSDKNFLPDFSHIYVESSAKDYPLTKACLTRFPKAAVVDVQDYKSIFNRPNQDFQIQKKSMKMILAVKKPPFIYKGTGILQDGGFKNFYYNTPILNCLYNCDYCFLQGMYPSANLVVFVNQEEMESAVHLYESLGWVIDADAAPAEGSGADRAYVLPVALRLEHY